jgi:hypothetical protein
MIGLFIEASGIHDVKGTTIQLCARQRQSRVLRQLK